MKFTEAQLDELKGRHKVDDVARKWVKLRKHGRGFIGPCPIHSPNSQATDSTAFECDAESWKCAVCFDGGDVIALVQRVENVGFIAAIERLGGTREIDAKEEERRKKEREAKRANQEKAAAHFRESERTKAWNIWQRGELLDSDGAAVTTVLNYLSRRGLTAPAGARLRAFGDMPYYDSGAADAAVIHRGPAMLAAIAGAEGHFSGVHITYLDLDRPNGKVALEDPRNGEPLPAKKVRGIKAAGHIELVRALEPVRLYAGEGIETVLSVWRALVEAGRDLTGVAFWSTVDLGNLGGASAASVRHPTLTTERGAARRVPGPEPAPDKPAMLVPASVATLIYLGDGDSDRFSTQCTIARGAQRNAAPGRDIRVAWAPDGVDFNDVLQGRAA